MKAIENNDDLKQLAPMLSSIEKKEVFSVPEGYFDSLPGQIMDSIAAAPSLEEIKVSNPFTVPEHYFEKLPLAISDKISAERKTVKAPSLIPYFLRPANTMVLAAACLALFFCIRFFEKPVSMNISKSSSPEAENIFLSESDVLGEVDESTLMNVATEETAIALKTGSVKSTGEKTLEDYIINNNIDISELAKEL